MPTLGLIGRKALTQLGVASGQQVAGWLRDDRRLQLGQLGKSPVRESGEALAAV